MLLGRRLGLAVRLIAGPGQRHDIALAQDLIDGIDADAAIADKEYDADHLLDKITKSAISTG